MIPVCTPLLGKNESKYVTDCLRTNWISSSGKYLKAFEDAFSQYCGTRYGITTTNGTSALHLALASLGIGPGDEVIMSTFTIVSTAFAVIYCGANPVFVDCEEDTFNINPDKIEEKISRKTKAIMPVHIYGHPCDMSKIIKIARRYNLHVIEDAAEAHGAEYKGKKVGGIGHLGCFSFYGNKMITTGEGGMVITNNKKIAKRCRSFKNLNFLKTKRFWHQEIGFNYRMTNIQAALGLAQLEQIEDLIKKRRKNASIYNSFLSGVRGLRLPIERSDSKNVFWMYSVVLEKEFGVSQGDMMRKLHEKGIETRPFFIPMHMQPALKKKGFSKKGHYPIAENIYKKGFYLPSGSDLKKTEIEYICDSIKGVRRRL